MKKNNLFWFLLGIGVIIFFITRLYHLLSLPIFTDEAIYMRWAQIARFDAFWRFISLTDGKQPMYVWFAMVFMHFVKDPLLAGRVVSVLSGLVTMVGLYFLGSEIFKNKWIGVISFLFYAIYPFGLVYDRMALYDSMVAAFMVWVLYLEILLARKVRLDIALLLGLVLGGAVLTKTNSFFGIYLLPLSLLLFDFKRKDKKHQLLKWGGFALLAVDLAYLYYSVLRLSPFFHIIDEKNMIFVYPVGEWLKHPFEFFLGNLFIGEWNWLHTYMTPFVLVLIIGSFFVRKSFMREKLFLLCWFLIPFLALAFFGKVIYPRFILFMTLPLIPLMADSLFRIYEFSYNKYFFAFVCAVFFIMPLRADYLILTNFPKAPIPDSDSNQYSNDWPSGGGVREAVQFFKEQSKNQKIYIATEGTFGLLPYAFEMYLESNPNIKIQGYWPMEYPVFQKLLDISKTQKTFFVFYQPCLDCPVPGLAPTTWHMEKVYQYEKPIGNRLFTVYQVRT